jgi:hypothetical protein
MRFRTILAAAVALVAVSGTAQAQSQVAQPGPSATSIHSVIVEADLATLVRQEGHTIDKIHPFEAPSVRGKTSDGLLFVVIGTACDKNGVPGCQGIMMQVRYDSDDRVTTDRLNQSNMAEAALSAWWDRDDKTVGFTRYVVLDNGVTWMNIRQNLRVLLSIVPKAQEYVFP